MISYVNISQAQVSDSGVYRCLADNGLASVSHEAQVSVLGPLQVKPMANLTVVASTTFRVRCPVAGWPIGDIQWHHNGRRLPANHRQHVYENGTLEVEHMEKSQGDEGEYTCIATAASNQPTSAPSVSGMSGVSQAAGSAAYGSLFISIKVRPTIEPFSVSRSLREGQRTTITCTISSGDLPISISWFRNQQQLVEETSAPVTFEEGLVGAPQVAQTNGSSSSGLISLPGVRMSRVSDYSSSLLFESLLVQHSGNYTCLARNEAGQVSHHASMVVQGKFACLSDKLGLNHAPIHRALHTC